jgi:FlaG/FlaF family flagellin (archaellin)
VNTTNIRKKLGDTRKKVRAISPVLAILLMIVITVAASLVTYAWVMGYLSFTTAKAGRAMQVQSVAYNSSTQELWVYVQNVGEEFVTLQPNSSVYVYGILQTDADVGIFGTDNGALQVGDTASIAVQGVSIPPGDRVRVRVVDESGTFTETHTYPLSGGGATPPTVTPPPTVIQVSSTDTGFSGVQAGDLLVVMPNTRHGSWTGDALTCTAAGYTTLEVAAYRDDDSDRRAVAVLVKTATGSETGTVSCTWDSPAYTYTTIYQIYRGATTWTYNGESGEASNGGGAESTSIPTISGLASSTAANVLSIGALVVRDNPGTVTMTNIDDQDSSVSSNCYTFTEFAYGDAVTQTDISWTTQQLATGILLQIECD